MSDRQASAEIINKEDQESPQEGRSQQIDKVQRVGHLQEVCDFPREAERLLQVGGESQQEDGCLLVAVCDHSREGKDLKDCKISGEALSTLMQGDVHQAGMLQEVGEAPK